ncbi:dienelactone hydrolase [Aspergillus uvarum CBS 121591]|uniref:Dienelactone hydrolase n=1 Tax=Aspergillus uvarum CBS 121591 TaxID=1448315 RepID=A0A319CJQ4_9EURO|nr:dienelactone hydrolase [Aspergillus uvarum CBS 121591]PYH84599.1 dienelactone hydrolase [Aspergillus uvarum CBS 121591]
MSLPNAKPVILTQSLILHPPLSHRGHGPGLIIIQTNTIPGEQNERTTLDPDPLQKWAEESYTVVQVTVSSDSRTVTGDLHRAINALREHGDCDQKTGYGVIVYPLPYVNEIVAEIDNCDEIGAVVVYGTLTHAPKKPFICHVPERGLKSTHEHGIIYHYGNVPSASFIVPSHRDFSAAPAAIAHTRCLTFLKKRLDGPWFDLEEIWDEHTGFEFEERSVESTMSTMVQEPYVNHIPTMTGGIGRQKLTDFYANHFIFNNPDDTTLELVSRTVGIDRVVDEFVMCFTHDKPVDWLIPGIPPTGKALRIPFIAVVNIRGDRLYHEHITWDQLTVLFQLGLMPDYLPIPYELPHGPYPQPFTNLEYRVPGAGSETADKMIDESSVTSNEMFAYAVRETTR